MPLFLVLENLGMVSTPLVKFSRRFPELFIKSFCFMAVANNSSNFATIVWNVGLLLIN